MAISVEIEHSSKNASDGFRRATKKYMKQGMSRGFAVSQNAVPEDRGGLRRDGFPPEERPDGTIAWGYANPYAEPQEEGTDPFTPPIRPLLEWGDRTFGTQTDPSTQEVLERIQNDEWGPDLFRHGGLAVWSKIRGEGIEPKGFMSDGAAASVSWFRRNDFSDWFEREF